MYKSVTERRILFHDHELSKTKKYHYLEPGLYHSITDIVEPMNSLIQNRNNLNTTCIGVNVDRRTQRVAFLLVNDESSLVIFSTDIGHFFEGDVRNDWGTLMFGKGPHKSLFAYDFFRIHWLMIYTGIVEYNIVGDTKTALLRCFPFISKLKSSDVSTTGHYMNYQTFRILPFHRLLKTIFIINKLICVIRLLKKFLSFLWE